MQRLAALAMAQLEETDAPEPAPDIAPTQPVPKVEAAPEPPPEPPVAEEPAPVVREPEPPAPTFQAPPPAPAPAPVAPPVPEPAPAPVTNSPSVALNLNSCAAEELFHIPGCSPELAESIVQYRTKIGSFKKLEDLLDVPGMTKMTYSALTGEAPPDGNVPQSLADLLGYPADQHITLKDVTDRISCWPDVIGCVLSQSSGLSLVGSVPANMDKAAIVAFAPRMFEAVNKSFGEITGKETDELIIPTPRTSFHILRNKDLYLIILSRLPQMPDRHLKVARIVLAGLTVR